MGKLYEFPSQEPPEDNSGDEDREQEPPVNLQELLHTQEGAVRRHPASHRLESTTNTEATKQTESDKPPLA